MLAAQKHDHNTAGLHHQLVNGTAAADDGVVCHSRGDQCHHTWPVVNTRQHIACLKLGPQQESRVDWYWVSTAVVVNRSGVKL